jgi:DNA-directed RNA polymerase specialized sigma subunit
MFTATKDPPSTDFRVVLVEQHSRLPGYWASRYRRLAQSNQVEFEDLVATAELAMIEVAASWGPGDGQFSRHATNHIRRSLRGLIGAARRMPARVEDLDRMPSPIPDPSRVWAFGAVWDGIAELKIAEQGIFILKYGLDRGGERSWLEVGHAMGLSHTAAKRIHDQVLPLLKALIEREFA